MIRILKPQRPVTTIKTLRFSEQVMETVLLDSINRYRAEQRLEGFRWSVCLARAARRHSQAMAQLGFFAHRDLAGREPSHRVREAGYGIFIGVGENIALGTRSPEETLQAWIDSPAHHELLLDRFLTEAGVGVARGASGRLIWTLNCARHLLQGQVPT